MAVQGVRDGLGVGGFPGRSEGLSWGTRETPAALRASGRWREAGWWLEGTLGGSGNLGRSIPPSRSGGRVCGCSCVTDDKGVRGAGERKRTRAFRGSPASVLPPLNPRPAGWPSVFTHTVRLLALSLISG